MCIYSAGVFFMSFIMSSVLFIPQQAGQSQSAVEESSLVSELQNMREQLMKSETERKLLETQLSEANSSVAQLQGEGRW